MTPRPAATLLLVRPAPTGMEVLMVERPARGYFGGLWVFPGGAVDAIDDSPEARRAVAAPPDCTDFAWRAAALRETVEEVGLAVTDLPAGAPLVAFGADVYRQAGTRTGRLAGDRLRLLSQWETPEGAPTRFDTRFYLAPLDGDPELVLQSTEIMACVWTTAADALTRFEEGAWTMVTPTLRHLEWLDGHSGFEAAWDLAGLAEDSRAYPGEVDDGSRVKVSLPQVAGLP